MEGRARPGPAGRLPLALARQGQLGRLALAAEFWPLLLQPEVQALQPFLAVVPAHAVHCQTAGLGVALPQPLGFVGAGGRADVALQSRQRRHRTPLRLREGMTHQGESLQVHGALHLHVHPLALLAEPEVNIAALLRLRRANRIVLAFHHHQLQLLRCLAWPIRQRQLPNRRRHHLRVDAQALPFLQGGEGEHRHSPFQVAAQQGQIG